MKKDTEIEERFSHLDLDDESRVYLHVQSKRYLYLLGILKGLRGSLPGPGVSIMDVGPSFFTQVLEEEFSGDTILSLGLDHPEGRGGHLPEDVIYDRDHFYYFDLNDSPYPEKWVQVPVCDIVILGEVLEHLYTAPVLILEFIKSFLKEKGYLVIQTPNAAATVKRIKLLVGRNPAETIRDNRDNPGHFREYTKKELISIAGECGFTVTRCELRNCFGGRCRIEDAYIFLNNFMPETFRDGITLVLRKEPG
jgi:predicted SAM-dependent methyltransferase